MSKKTSSSPKPAKLPKKKCCVSSSRCRRCPIRMLREGTLPEGYTVRKRRLVSTAVVVADEPALVVAGQAPKKRSKKSTEQRGRKAKRGKMSIAA